MQHLGAAAAVLVALLALAQQPAYMQQPADVVVILYPPSDCKMDFDADYWAKYDSAMAKEWGIASQTMCLDGLSAPEKVELVSALQGAGINVITMVIDNSMLPDVPGVQGMSRPQSNFGTVNFNYYETTRTVSHETLHLVLEGRGYEKSCYVDAVHENAYSLARHDGNVMIIGHFECG
jgi:hypothetical protein